MSKSARGRECFPVADRSEMEAMACLLVSGAVTSVEKLPEQSGQGTRTPDLELVFADGRIAKAEVTQHTHGAASSMFSAFRGPPKSDKKLSYRWDLSFSDRSVSDPDRKKPERLDLARVSGILAESEGEHPGDPTGMSERADHLLGEMMIEEVLDRFQRQHPEISLSDGSQLARRSVDADREARKLKVVGAPELVGPGEGSVKLHASTSFLTSPSDHLSGVQKHIDHKDHHDQGAEWLIVVLDPATTASEKLIEDCRRADHSPVLGQPTVNLDRRGFQETWVVALDNVGYSVLRLLANGHEWERFPYFGRHAGLGDLLAANPEGTLRRLVALPDHSRTRQGGLMRHEAMNALSGAIRDCPEAGLAIADLVITDPRLESSKPAQESIEMVLRSWADQKTALGGEISEQIASRLDCIWDWGADEAERAALPLMYSSGITWLDLACNHWAGHIARIAVRLISLERQDAGQDWPGLTDRWVELLEKMIGGDGNPSKMAQATLARWPRLLLHDAEPGWWQDNVLPLFDCDADEGRALRCWDAQLGSRELPTVEMLEAGMLDCFLKVLRVGQKLDHYSRWDLYSVLAQITLQPGIAPDTWTQSLEAALVEAGPAIRIQWTQAVAGLLAGLSSGEADTRWDALSAYWETRLNSTAAPIAPAEATELACWAFHLGDRAREAVDLAIRQPAFAIDDENQLPRVLAKAGVWPEKEEPPSCPPEQAARLLAHMLVGFRDLSTPETVWTRQHLEFAVTSLLDHLGDDPHAVVLKAAADRQGLRTDRCS